MFDRFKQDAYRWSVYHPRYNLTDISQLSAWLIVQFLIQHLPLRAMAWFRFGSWCHQKHIPFLPGHVQRRIYRHYGLEIVIGADIDGGLYIPHPIGTVIAPKRIGCNCSIIASTTIGMRNKQEFPTIGDNVFIGAGARVLGGVFIGNNVNIGSNAVVIHDIPENSTAIGIPAKIIR
jgi:serine O-acetyltransferase